jgi:hypothetical protein
MIEVGVLKNFNSGTYKAGVQLAGSLTTYFDDVSVAKNIPSAAMVVGNYVILAIPGGNPKDACVIASWPQGGGTFLDLSDTPSSYSGQAGKFPKVKATEDGLEFIDAYRVVNTPVTYTIGAAGNYPTLAAACGDLRSLILEDDIILELLEDVTETAQIDIRGLVSMGGRLIIELNGYTSNWTQGGDTMFFVRGNATVWISTDGAAGGTILINHPSPSGVAVMRTEDSAFLRLSRISAVTLNVNNQAVQRVFRIAGISILYWRDGTVLNGGNVTFAFANIQNAARGMMENALPTPWAFHQGGMIIDENGDIWTTKGKVT